MNIGVSLFSARHPIDPAVVAQQAEALGFDSLWMGEHPVMPVHSTSPAPGSSGDTIPDFYSRLVDPFVALARASAVTTTLTDLDPSTVGMTSVVIVGNSSTRVIDGRMVTPRGYLI